MEWSGCYWHFISCQWQVCHRQDPSSLLIDRGRTFHASHWLADWLKISGRPQTDWRQLTASNFGQSDGKYSHHKFGWLGANLRRTTCSFNSIPSLLLSSARHFTWCRKLQKMKGRWGADSMISFLAYIPQSLKWQDKTSYRIWMWSDTALTVKISVTLNVMIS